MDNTALYWLGAVTVATITIMIIRPRKKHDTFGLRWSFEMSVLIAVFTTLAIQLAFLEWFADILQSIALHL